MSCINVQMWSIIDFSGYSCLQGCCAKGSYKSQGEEWGCPPVSLSPAVPPRLPLLKEEHY